jgi:hypothetical protein
MLSAVILQSFLSPFECSSSNVDRFLRKSANSYIATVVSVWGPMPHECAADTYFRRCDTLLQAIKQCLDTDL